MFKTERPTILLVEDNLPLQELLRERLVMEGFSVTTASSVREARKILAADSAGHTLTLADYLLPDGTGLELLDEVPNHAFFLVSGTIFENGPPVGVSFLAKPFLLSDLVLRLKEALASAA